MDKQDLAKRITELLNKGEVAAMQFDEFVDDAGQYKVSAARDEDTNLIVVHVEEPVPEMFRVEVTRI